MLLCSAGERAMEKRRVLEERLYALDEEASWNAFIDARRPSAQMSKSSSTNDIDGLQRLIVEKERDLELAARIGQSLLSKNNLLQHNHDELTQLYSVTQDEITQLRHELSMSKELLKIYLRESPDDDCGDDSESYEHASIRQIQLLQRKIRYLEDENHRLRQEARDLSAEAAEFDTKETEIIHDCVKELAESNVKTEYLQETLRKKNEENGTLQDEVGSLLDDMLDLQARMKRTASENDELKGSQEAYKENQNQLAYELIQLQDRYDRLSSFVHDLEDEIKELRKRDSGAASWNDSSYSSSFLDSSLAAELNLSLQHVFNSVGCSEDEADDQYRKVMDIVRLVNVQRSQAQTSTTVSNPAAACLSTVSSSGISSRKSGSLSARTVDDSEPALGSFFGSGASDLPPVINYESASSVGDDGICDKSYWGPSSLSSFDGRQCATPDSAMSLGAGSDVSGSQTQHHHDLSTKLQLIKPMEGSAILAKWQKLATPNMGGFLESRPGILTKAHNPKAEHIIAEEKKVIRKDSRGTDSGLSGVVRDLPTNTSYTFTNAKGGQTAGFGSIFSVGALKTDKLSSPRPVFPGPPANSAEPAVNLCSILDTARSSSPSHTDDEIIQIESPTPSASSRRSRRSSGSLSSASRSPSPPTSAAALQAPSLASNPFRTLYSGLASAGQPINRLSVRNFRVPSSNPGAARPL